VRVSGTIAALAAALLSWSVLALGCGTGPGDELEGRAAAPIVATGGPFLRVLGTAQDGGLPHVACSCPRCDAARVDPSRARAVAALAVVVPERGTRYLIDATPDIRIQLDRLPPRPDAPAAGTDRAPVDGVFLTHAHLGHYTGLAFFGYEAAHTRGLPLYCTPSMARYLGGNGPWDQLVRLGNVDVRPVDLGGAVDLEGGVRITFLPSPHRQEYTDTVAFRIEGPSRTVLYVPDTDRWEDWNPTLEDRLEGVDVALLDGTFYSLDELPGRKVESIGHPLMTVTMDRLETRVRTGTVDVAFTHLNHSNPALDPDGPERAEIVRRGFRVLSDGEDLPL
jgi:pyrroloquinoline quinone biosynthesis protein B